MGKALISRKMCEGRIATANADLLSLQVLFSFDEIHSSKRSGDVKYNQSAFSLHLRNVTINICSRVVKARNRTEHNETKRNHTTERNHATGRNNETTQCKADIHGFHHPKIGNTTL